MNRGVPQSSIVSKCATVIDLVCKSPRALGLSEITQVTGLPKSSVHRLLSILQEEGLLVFEAANNGYAPGPRLINWSTGTLSVNDLPSLARPMMETLSKQTDCHVALAILNGTNVLFIATVDPVVPYRLSPSVGEQSPSYCTAVGKVLLSQLNPARLELVLEQITFERFTELTHAAPENLNQELKRVRSEGFGECDREEFLQIAGIGTPIFDHNNFCIAAVSIWGQVKDKNLVTLRAHKTQLRDCANGISARLGYQPE